MTAAVLVNGSPDPVVSIHDRGLAFGDGVFRTLLVRAGRPLNWERQYRRLVHDCVALALTPPGEHALLGEIAAVAPQEAVVKITVTRGAGPRGYAIAGGETPTRVVAAHPLPDYPEALAREGVHVRWCELVLGEQPRLAGVKSLNRLESVFARSEWDDPGIREGLLCDAAGCVIGGTMSNVFIVLAGALATPELSRCGVAGAQRERIIDLARDAGVSCEVRDIGVEELGRADEVFLTNSLMGLWPVSKLDDREWTRFPVADRFRERIADDDSRAA
ncbi:aminodeoxychorismate lyase [Usitatibacter palustris]|uniref:aminodeoxychorismate lyase n=1 Tax=Usitatibacter palustris TaxID=2732487 RepID=A0A6M4H7R6_9PROT|nr:aminodeoxychorismate lyase [Usitatibacter palustris]QJR15205.1 Aminodeoxychorismate lyase [Usitatibacter palustris]